MNFRYAFPTTLVFGSGSLQKLGKQRLPGKNALVVISNGQSVKTSGALDTVLQQLDAAGIPHTIYAGVKANPTLDNVTEGAAAGRAAGCDFVIGLGGGSSIDAAKAIAVMLTNDGNYWDYQFSGTGGRQKMKHAPAPLVAIPTTAGTGTETDPWMVVSNEATKEKIGGGTMKSFPALALVDPALMTSVPPRLTAYQGFDALFHGIECYLSKAATPMSDLYSLGTVKLISGYLERACRDGSDLEARENVALGSTLAGFAMTLSGNGSQHALEHALSAFHPDLPHGAGLILLSTAWFPYLAENKPEIRDRFLTLASALGVKDPQGPEALADALDALRKACGVNALQMSDFGITREEIPALADNARETMGMLFDADRFDLSRDECIAILTRAYR